MVQKAKGHIEIGLAMKRSVFKREFDDELDFRSAPISGYQPRRLVYTASVYLLVPYRHSGKFPIVS